MKSTVKKFGEALRVIADILDDQGGQISKVSNAVESALTDIKDLVGDLIEDVHLLREDVNALRAELSQHKQDTKLSLLTSRGGG